MSWPDLDYHVLPRGMARVEPRKAAENGWSKGRGHKVSATDRNLNKEHKC